MIGDVFALNLYLEQFTHEEDGSRFLFGNNKQERAVGNETDWFRGGAFPHLYHGGPGSFASFLIYLDNGFVQNPI